MTRCLPAQGLFHHAGALAIFSLGLMLLPACEGEGALTVVQPELFTEPAPGTALVFGEVVLGRTEADLLRIDLGNRGAATLVIEDVRIQGPGAEQFSIRARPQTVGPGGAGELFIGFEPTGPAEHSATLVVQTNDPQALEVAWPLAGPAREPCSIEVRPDYQSFLLGEVRDVTIDASDAYKCVITGIETDRALFEILNEPDFPVEIPAGESLNLQIQHTNASVAPGGTPTRQLLVREQEGTEDRVILAGVPPVQGCLAVNTNRLEFPRAARGTVSQRSLRVRNQCADDVASVTSIALSQGFYFYQVDTAPYPVEIPPLQSIEIPVIYEAFSPQGDPGLLSVNTNDATNPRFRIELYGEADVPAAEVFPRELDFGTVVFKNPQGAENRSECSSPSQEIRVYSVGAAPLTIDRIDVDPASDAFFLITSVILDGEPIFDINQQIVVPPESELRISIQFYPTRVDPADHSGRLRLVNDGDDSTIEVALRGRGVPDGQVTDVFDQLEGPTVDILWVIDDSCSMYDEQARLISNLSQFVGYADSQNADYRMAVTVTDAISSQAGKFRRCFPHPPIIDRDYADSETRQEAFECTFLVGTNNISFYEAGLGAAKRALERAISPTEDPATNPNAGFVRPNAKLAVVAVSDENDQTRLSDQVLLNFFLSIKGFNRPDQMAVHAIAGPVFNECAQGARFAEPGIRYFSMTQATGGQFFDICQPDWQPVLTNLGLDVFTPLDEWNLSQAADPGSLVVTVDGVPVAVDPIDGYTYVLASNSIRFNGGSVPAPGAQIVADYSGLCRP